MADKARNITTYPAEKPAPLRDETSIIGELRPPEKESDSRAHRRSFFKKNLYRLTHWETWDWRIKYLLIGPAWLWFCLRARSLWFFTASNPTLTFGGFEGESKKEMYNQLPSGSFPESIFVHPNLSIAEVEQMLSAYKMTYPLAVKPDVGKMGLMFRRLDRPEQLAEYHSTVAFEYIIQRFVDYPLELSVFYYRIPDATKGTITGFIRKDFLEVTGDGKSTLWELMLDYPRVQFRLEELAAKHHDKLDTVLASGERYCLSSALNLSRGGKLVSLEHEKDERLLKVFDGLSHYTGSFYYGRYDIKCRSIDDLKRGEHFTILEYNGSGAEPHHVYGNGYSLFQACYILVKHWAVLCKISRINRKRGFHYWDLARGWKHLERAGFHVELLRKLDHETPV